MFVIGQMPRFSSEATVTLASPDDPAATVDYSITLIFQAMGLSAARKVDAEARELETADAVARHYESFLNKVVVGWEGAVDGAGKTVLFTPSALSQALDIPGFAAAAMEAYRSGLDASRRKN